MQLKSILLAATAASSALSMPTLSLFSNDKAVPGYPWGLGQCLSDQQAAFVVRTFKSILTNPDRKAAVATANIIIADKYVESSDSINVLAGYPQGGVSFDGKQAFIDGIKFAPAIAVMNDLDIWHDCNKIGWQWLVDGLALDVSPVKGFNKFTVDVKTGMIKANDLEFNSIAWGQDLGGTWTAPPHH